MVPWSDERSWFSAWAASVCCNIHNRIFWATLQHILPYCLLLYWFDVSQSWTLSSRIHPLRNSLPWLLCTKLSNHQFTLLSCLRQNAACDQLQLSECRHLFTVPLSRPRYWPVSCLNYNRFRNISQLYCQGESDVVSHPISAFKPCHFQIQMEEVRKLALQCQQVALDLPLLS